MGPVGWRLGSRGDWGLGLEMWGVKLFYALRKCKMMATGGKGYKIRYSYLCQPLRPWGLLIAY